MFNVAVVVGCQIINIKVDLPYKRRFSLFQTFTHFGYPGKLVNTCTIFSNMQYTLLCHSITAYTKLIQLVRMKISTTFCLFVHVCVMLVVPRSKFMLGVVLSFQLNFPIATANFLLLNNCNCGIISPHNCNCDRNCIPLLANNCKCNCK